MWGGWVGGLGRRLDSLTGLDISPQLFRSFGFDPITSRVAPDGPLAVWSMAALSELAVDVLRRAGLDLETATVAARGEWYTPDPVELARPLANLPRLFAALKANDVKTGVATSDDRAATEATLAGLGIGQYVDAVVGADDGMPSKPAPEMVLYLCRLLGVIPAETAVIGDAVADLIMGRSAGAGLVVGVLSGVSSPEILAPFADVLVSSVGDLVM
jgi:phosphoglycolate phosphatase